MGLVITEKHQISMLASCLEKLGYDQIASFIKLQCNQKLIDKFSYFTIIVARIGRRQDIIESMDFVGLTAKDYENNSCFHTSI